MENSEFYKKVGMKIRELRESKGMSLQDFSLKLDIEYNNLVRIEKGRTNPTLATLIKISHTLNVKVKDVVDVE